MAILSVQSGSSDKQADNRKVALLKSLATNNRFYTLVSPDSGLKNADTIERFTEDMILGIAYPCLEDGLNDFAIIRSTFETLDQFPDDEELRAELMDIITDAQGKLSRRIVELRDYIGQGQAHFLGTDMSEFKDYVVNLVVKGVPRRTLDSMMKLDVFESVASTEALLSGNMAPEFMYHYEFLPQNDLGITQEIPPRPFITRVFQDVLSSIEDPNNYLDKQNFDRNVFQKFIALMFVNYATTDPVFYGTNKADYGVSADKDMDQTPLYIAVGKALRMLERARKDERDTQAAVEPVAARFEKSEEAPVGTVSRTVELSTLPIADQHLLEQMRTITDTARILLRLNNQRAGECGVLILRSTQRLFTELKGLGILSPAAESPVDADLRE